VFCEVKPEYAKTAQPGDVIVGGQNFGCGSSREHAPIAIKGSQAQCVIAASFARIFFRNAINIGLPILECPEAAADITEGDDIEANLLTGEIFNHSNGHRYQAHPLPDFVLRIADAGGIVNFLKTHDIQELLS
jgi:3-isopropylmalate/(R)-2-methylmalate dehydratase small subunit